MIMDVNDGVNFVVHVGTLLRDGDAAIGAADIYFLVVLTALKFLALAVQVDGKIGVVVRVFG